MTPPEEPNKRQITRAQWTLIASILALAVISLAIRYIAFQNWPQTGALFVGFPTVLAIMLSLSGPTRSATGMALKGTTIALLMAGILLGEGIVCIVFAAPIFYIIAVIAGWLIDRDRRRREEGGNRLYSIGLIPLLLMSMEGATPALTFSPDITVSRTKIVDASPAQVEQKLTAAASFSPRLPAFLALGFPRPVTAEGSGLDIGDGRVMHYKGKDSELVTVVAARAPGYVQFKPVRDTSPIAKWLTWNDSEVRWRDAGSGRTEIIWTLRFTRRLAPAWYFGPIETFGVSETAGYLIDALAAP